MLFTLSFYAVYTEFYAVYTEILCCLQCFYAVYTE